jgi:putative ABC transport system permease protein
MPVRGHFEALIQDLRYSIRVLLRERVFTATVLVMLALSIGSTAAVFTFVDLLLLRPLPVSSPERLFSISAGWQKHRPQSLVLFAWFLREPPRLKSSLP